MRQFLFLKKCRTPTFLNKERHKIIVLCLFVFTIYLKIIVAVIVGVVVLGGGVYLAIQTIFKSEEVPKVSNDPNQSTTEIVTPAQSSEQPAT